MAEDSKLELHNPAEIFGFPPSNRSKEAEEMRNAGKCPFTGEKCTKESRLLNTPFGVCSVWHGGTPRIICPPSLRRKNPAQAGSISLSYQKSYSH